VVRYAKDAGMTGRITAQHVFGAAHRGEPAAVSVVQQIAKRLAQLVASVCAVLDPELIVVGGGVGQNLDILLPDIQSALLDITPMQPTLTLGRLGQRAVVDGARAYGLELARERAFTTRT
jgi:predicted NBD/HSP70 family sugar kinase